MPCSVTLISTIGVFSITSKSSHMAAQELETRTGPNGWKLKLNQIQSTSASRVTQFASSQDASHQSAITSTQVPVTPATRKPKPAAQLERRASNGPPLNLMPSFQTLLKPLLNKRTKTKLEELSADLSTTSKTTRLSRNLHGFNELGDLMFEQF